MKRTLILCAHGSHTLAGRSSLASLVNAVRREAPEYDVVDAFIDTQQPMLSDVVREVRGPRMVVPLTLTHNAEVPLAIAQGAAGDADVSLSSPLGPDWVLAELGVRRLIEAGARPDDTILLAADEADSERAIADVSKAARLLSAVWGGRVHVGTIDGMGSPLAEAIDVARAYGRRVVVSMYALTMSAAVSAIGELGADVVTGPLLSGGPPEPRLVSLVLARATTKGSWTSLLGDPQIAQS